MAERRSKPALASLIVLTYLRVRLAMPRRTLAELVAQAPRSRGRRHEDVRHLSRAVSRVLARGGEQQVRCIHRSLVLHRLLVAQGDDAELVIGLPPDSTGTRAHAWVEIGGRDVGPAPGRGRHEPLARYS